MSEAELARRRRQEAVDLADADSWLADKLSRIARSLNRVDDRGESDGDAPTLHVVSSDDAPPDH